MNDMAEFVKLALRWLLTPTACLRGWLSVLAI